MASDNSLIAELDRAHKMSVSDPERSTLYSRARDAVEAAYREVADRDTRLAMIMSAYQTDPTGFHAGTMLAIVTADAEDVRKWIRG